MRSRKTQFMYTYRSVRRRGCGDGRSWRWALFFHRLPKQPQPLADQTDRAIFENELQQAAEADIQLLAKDWAKEDEKLKRDYCGALKEKQQAEEVLKKETAEADAARDKLGEIEGTLAELGEPAISGRARNAWLVILGLLEFPVNYVVFQLMGESIWITALMSAGLGVLIPGLAHFTGHRFRQQQQTSKDRILLWISPFIAIGLVVFIAFWRGEFMSVNEMSHLLGLKVSPLTATLMFVLLNLAFFFLALFISYEGTHPRAAVYSRVHKHLRELRRRLAKESGEAAAAVKREESAAKALTDARARREQRFEVIRQDAHGIAQSYEHLVTVYRNASLSRRDDVPPCFKLPIQPAELPSIFLSDGRLDWNCV